MISTHPEVNTARVNRFEYTAPELPEADDGSVLGAAFRLENDVVNAFDLLSRQNYAPDVNFDYLAKAQESQLFQNNADSFVGVESLAEWNAIEQRLLREQKDRAIIDAAGFTGIAAGMLAGVVSPTVLLPAGIGAKAKTVKDAAISAAGWAFVGVGAQETILQTNQELRTGMESAVSIGTGVVAASILGGLVKGLSKAELDGITSGMDAYDPAGSIQYGLFSTTRTGSVNTADLADDELVDALTDALRGSVEPEDLSAAANAAAKDYKAFPDPGGIAAGGQMWSWLGPVTRGAMARFPSMRATMSQLSTGGVAREGNMDFVATAAGGDVETRAMAWQANLAKGIESERQLFYDWYKRTGKGGKFRGFFARSEMERFNTEVGRAMEMKLFGRTHTVPEVAAAADRYIQDSFLPLIREAKANGMPAFQNLTDIEALRIAQQKVKADLLFKDRDALTDIVREHANWQLRNNTELLQNPKIRAWLELDEATPTGGSRILGQAEYANAVAEKIVAKWEGSFNKHGTLTTMNELPIPKEFVYIDPNRVWSNGRAFGEFLERNVEKVARSYTRAMAGDVELFARYGTTTPNMREAANKAAFWSDIEKEFKKGIEEINADEALDDAAKEKARFKLEMELKAFERDFTVIVDRIRHTRGQPDDPRALGFRAARMANNINTMRLMGMVAISSIPDMGRLVLKHGFTRTFKDVLIPLFTNLRQIKMGMREARFSGASLDVTLHGRSNAVFDIFEEAEYGNAFERGVQTGTNYIGAVGLFDYWNQAMKGLSSSLTMGEISDALSAQAADKITRQQIKFLSSIGIDEPLAKRLWAKLSSDGGEEIRPGVFFPNTEDWGKIDGEDIYDFEKMEYRKGLTNAQIKKAEEDAELARVYRAALARNIVDTITTPGVERPNMVDSSAAARVIFQFRSFGLSSTLKSVAAAGQDARMGNLAPVLSGVSFSLALGAVSYYLWGMSFGPGSKQAKEVGKLFDAAISGDEDAMLRIADESIARSGLLGVLEEVRRVGERIPATRPFVTLANQQTSRSPFERPVTEALGPSAGLLEELDKLAVTFDEPRGSTFDAARRLTPYQNVFWLRWGMEQLYNGAKGAAGVN